jgi:hypothetical protein
MDIFFPPSLIPTAMNFSVDDFTAVDESATTGVIQSSTLYGTRRWRLRMDFAALSRASGALGRFEALVASLRGRANRIWINPTTQRLRGSFPAWELFGNNDFANGTSGWSTYANHTAAVVDRVFRASRVLSGAAYPAYQGGMPYVQYAPQACRVFAAANNPSELLYAFVAGPPPLAALSAGSAGYGVIAYVPVTTSGDTAGLYDTSTNGMAGEYIDVYWQSFSRCALVDNGVNLLLHSDTPGGTSWSLFQASAALTSSAAPDGTLSAYSLSETTVNSQHFVYQTVTISASAQDVSFSIFAQAGNRTWCLLEMVELSGSTGAIMYFNLATGAAGSTPSTGANWSNLRSSVTNYGNGWRRFTITARKTNAATVIQCMIAAATGDNVSSYVGVTSPAALLTWRASCAAASVTGRPVATAGTAQGATGQTGNTLYLKGLPASTTGLLLQGDMVEIDLPTNSQLVRVTARLDSDADGLGVLQFENALKQSPADNAAVIVQQPLGRFVLAASSLGVEYTPGVFGQASLEFVEAA